MESQFLGCGIIILLLFFSILQTTMPVNWGRGGLHNRVLSPYETQPPHATSTARVSGARAHHPLLTGTRRHERQLSLGCQTPLGSQTPDLSVSSKVTSLRSDPRPHYGTVFNAERCRGLGWADGAREGTPGSQPCVQRAKLPPGGCTVGKMPVKISAALLQKSKS